ncbi:MAG: peptidylprolyl isomerase [Halobacteriota archaeon]
MSLGNGDFVKISYTGKLENGDVFDTTDIEVAKQHGIYAEGIDYNPIIIVVGENMVVRGLDEDLIGKEVGYEGTVVVPPEKAFGHRNPELVEVVPTRRFEKKPVPGMRVNVGNRAGIIENVVGGRVRVDFNLPYAGKAITYNYKIEKSVGNTINKIKGLIEYYLHKDFVVSKKGKIIRVEIPYEFAFNQTVQYYKGVLAEKIMRFIDVEEVEYVELHKKPHAIEEAKSEVTDEQEKPEEIAEKSDDDVANNFSK